MRHSQEVSALVLQRAAAGQRTTAKNMMTPNASNPVVKKWSNAPSVTPCHSSRRTPGPSSATGEAPTGGSSKIPLMPPPQGALGVAALSCRRARRETAAGCDQRRAAAIAPLLPARGYMYAADADKGCAALAPETPEVSPSQIDL